jgi:glycosyltransferase involved in cell wall biosynthesis
MTGRRIAFVSDAVWPYHTGGKEKRLYEIGRRLAADGWQVDVYTMRWWSGPDEPIHDGVRYHAVCRRLPLYVGRRRGILQAVVFGAAVLRLLWADFDVLDVDHMPFFPVFAARLVCSVRRRPLVGTWLEVWGWAYWTSYLGPAGVFGGLAEAIAVRLPDSIVSISELTTARLGTMRGAARAVTISPGADLAHLRAVVPADDSAQVVFAGRLLAHKNADLVVRAASVLRDRGCCPRVRIIGEGPERQNLAELVDGLALGDLVELVDFLPNHDDLIAQLKAASVVVLPSDREGFGIVALEALACGVPVVTIDAPDNAVKELVDDGVNGVVAVRRPDALADAIRACLEGRVGTTADLSRFDWSRTAAQVAAVYEQASGRAS